MTIKDNRGNDMKCDGETFFGFTVKACDKPATVSRLNGTHERYWFCARHDYFYFNGRYPEDPKPEEKGNNDAIQT